MTPRPQFHPLQAVEIANAFEAAAVDYLRDIIQSKRASNRQKDLVDLELLEAFREEYERHHAPPLRSATEIAEERADELDDTP